MRIAAGWAAALLALAAAGCELTETVIGEPEDVVVAEAVLRAGEPYQFLYLHRTLALADSVSREVVGATVWLRDEHGNAVRYLGVPFVECLADEDTQHARDGTCYAAVNDSTLPVRPGGRYSLEIVTADGQRLAGTTTLPGDFELLQPATPDTCRIPPGTTGGIAWTRSAGAWVYAMEARFDGLDAALEAEGIEVPYDPIELSGLAIGEQDTTVLFPTEFGVFDRADDRLAPLLLAIRDGLPENVTGTVVVAASERNFVNWVRGGSFNPSGTVRVPSIHGDGIGVLGGLVPKRFHFVVTRGMPELPACFGP